MQNCHDITLWNPLFGLFVFLSRHYSEGSQVPKVTLYFHILKWKSRVGQRSTRAAKKKIQLPVWSSGDHTKKSSFSALQKQLPSKKEWNKKYWEGINIHQRGEDCRTEELPMCSTPNKEWAELGWPGGEHLLVLNCFEHLLAMIHIKTFQCTALHAIQYTMHCILFTIVQYYSNACCAMHCNWLQRIAIHWASIELCRELLTLDHTELLHDV